MAIWKKFFEEDKEDKNEKNDIEVAYYDDEAEYDKIRNKKKKSKLESWFAEDYNSSDDELEEKLLTVEEEEYPTRSSSKATKKNWFFEKKKKSTYQPEDNADYEEDYFEDKYVEHKKDSKLFSNSSQNDTFDNYEERYIDEEDDNDKTIRTKKKSKLAAWFANDSYDDDHHYEEDINEEDINEEDYLIEEKEEKKSLFSNWFSKRKQQQDDYYNQDEYEHVEDQDEYEDDTKPDSDYVKNKEDKQTNGIFAKFTNLFKGNNTTEFDDNYEDEDAPEDYKTYLERQKIERQREQEISELAQNETTNNTYDLEIEFTNVQDEAQEFSNYNQSNDINDDYDDDFKEYLEEDFTPKKESRLTSIKDKISSLANYGLKEDEMKNLYDDEEVEEDFEKEKKENFFSRFKKQEKFETSEDEIEDIDNNEDIEEDLEDFSLAKELDAVEEKEVDELEQENLSIKEQLSSLGIVAEEIKEVDIFEERSEQRRQHPTLASVKVRRIMQQHQIEDFGNDLIFEEDKEQLKSDLFEKKETNNVITTAEPTSHTSKNEEEIKQLNAEFNKLQRKEDKISSNNSFFKNNNDERIDEVLKEIKEQKENSAKDLKNYDIEVTAQDEKERREKLKYTTVDDVLLGNEDLFENDVDRAAKIIVVPRTNVEEKELPAEDVEQFRQDVFKDAKQAALEIHKERTTNLDKLIVDTNLIENSKDEVDTEIDKLEENLSLIKEEKYTNNSREIIDDFEEEISIEQVAKDSEPTYVHYDDIKKEENFEENILEGYSDYNLDLEEIEELNVKNKIDSASEQADIDTLTATLMPNNKKKQFADDIEKFTEEKTYTPKKYDDSSTDEFYEIPEKKEKIEYVEKLYTHDVQEFFVDDNGPLVFGEYKTRDYGYRPVSKETIESNQRKLDAIFDKYSNVQIPKRNTTSYVEKKLTETKNVGKYKPTPVYSSIYGNSTNKDKSAVSSAKQNISSTVVTPTIQKQTPTEKSAAIFQEIAEQEETVWNIELSNRVPKTKGRKKK